MGRRVQCLPSTCQAPRRNAKAMNRRVPSLLVILLRCWIHQTADAFSSCSSTTRIRKASFSSSHNDAPRPFRRTSSRSSFQPIRAIPEWISSDTNWAELASSALGLSPKDPNTAKVLQFVAEEEMNALGRDVLTFLAASVAVVPLSRVLKVTPVLTFLAAGCLLGPHGLGTFTNNEADLQLGDFGILFLLFSEGLNLSPDRLRDLGAFYGLGILQISASMALFFAFILVGGPMVLEYVAPVIQMDDYVYSIFGSPVQAFCIAAAGALSSSAFVLPVLKAKKWENRPEGIAALSILLLQDLAVAPLLVLLPLVAGSGPQSAGELSWLAAKATLGFGAVLAVGSVLLRYVFDIVASARSTETFVAAALLVALGMGQAADALGLSATTGAFAAGVLLAGNRYRAQIKADVRPFEGILLGIFFMTAGASLNPIIVLNNIPVLATGIVAFITVKALVLFLGGASLGKSWGSAARVAITLSGGGEFSLVLFKVAQDLGVLQKDLADLLIASVIISMSLTPFLGDLADAYGSYLESREGVKSEGGLMTKAEAEALFESIDTDQSGSIELEELQEALIPYRLNYITIAEIFAAFDVNGDGTISGEEWTAGVEAGLLASALVMGEAAAGAGAALQPQQAIASDAICICGYTEFGKEMMSVLRAVGATKNGGVVAFELNPKRVAAAVSLGVNVVYGDGASPSLLRAAGVTNPRAVIVAFRSESRRLEATSRLREALPAGTPIYAREVSGQLLGRDELIQAGATECVSERREAALRFADLVGVVNTDQAALLRGDLGLEVFDVAPAPETIPGIPEDRFEDLVTEFGCTKRELERLYKIFSSVPGMNGERFIDISELRDVFLRTAGDGPIDDEELERWTEMANSDGGGKLSFVDFARVYFSTRMAR